MEILEYKNIVNETARYPQKVDNFGLAYTYLGLIGENAEYMEELDTLLWANGDREKYVKETGDVIWYVTAMSNILHLNITHIFETYVDNPPSIDSLAENIKKHYRDSKPIDTLLVQKVLQGIVSNINKDLDFINTTRKLVPITLEEILQKNWDKLMSRRENNTLHGDGSDR